MKVINLIKAEFTMLFGELKQYSLNYIFYNLGLLVMFMGIFFTTGEKEGPEGLILLFGLAMWQIASSAIGYLGYIIQDEAALGTLEQIFMTRTNIFQVFCSKVIVNFVFSVVKAAILFFICAFAFGIQGNLLSLGIKGFLVFFVTIIVVVSFYIVGLMFGGMALFFKRISNVVQVISYLLLFFTNITIPVNELPYGLQIISSFVPISWAMDIIRAIIKNEPVLLQSIVGFGISSVCYVVLGVYIFVQCISIAKQNGKLAGY